MIVHVRLFARARDLAGADSVAVELPDGATVADLRRRLAADHSALVGLLKRSALAVESEFAEDSRMLTANMEIALLPPVSGGEGNEHPILNHSQSAMYYAGATDCERYIAPPSHPCNARIDRATLAGDARKPLPYLDLSVATKSH
jgi:molybdopterin synthase catalytic subunit